MSKFFFFSLLLFYSFSFGQKVETVLGKMKEKYRELNTISYSTVYELYKGHKSNEVEDAYSGVVFKNTKGIYQKIKETEFIYGDDFSIRLDHEHNSIELGLATKVISGEVDMDLALKECYEKTMEDKGEYYSLTLKLRSTSSVPLSVLKIRIEKESYLIVQMDLYYSDNIDFSTNRSKKDLHQPHLKIKFFNHSFSNSALEKKLLFENYFKTNNNIITPVTEYKRYRFIDNRV